MIVSGELVTKDRCLSNSDNSDSSIVDINYMTLYGLSMYLSFVENTL